jgi:hypothetical protein
MATARLAPATAAVPRTVALDYQRLAGAGRCPDESALRAGVSARLGYDPFRADATQRLRVTLAPAGAGLEARIDLVDGAGRLTAERRLSARGRACDDLAASVALAVAIAIDPVGLAPADRGAPVSEERTQPRSRDVAPAGEAAAPPALLLHVAALVGLGSAPAPNLGLRAGAALRGMALSFGLEARADLPSTATLRAGEASGGLLVASVLPCAHVGSAAVCALVTAGVLRVAGRGLIDARRETLPYLGFGMRLAWTLPLTARVGLRCEGDVTAPATRTQLTVSDTVVWTSDAAAFTLGVGLVVRIP